MTAQHQVIANLIKEIGLKEQRIQYSDTGTIIGLDLSKLSLSKIPPYICDLVDLEDINLENNTIELLPARISQLKNLKKLSLRSNKIKTIPPEVWQLTSLQVLDVYHNLVTSISSDIANLSNLQTLNLWSNRLRVLPDQVGTLINLKELNLGGNSLENLPDNIWSLTNLRVLWLGGNRITTIPLQISQLTVLEVLGLWGNGLQNLPSNIGDLPRLREMHLRDNPGLVLPQGIWALKNLKILLLNNIDLSYIPDEIKHLRKLNRLNLSNNKIREIPSELWELSELRELNLANNQIVNVSPEIANLSKLEILSLRSNQLAKIPAEISSLNKLQQLDLSDNHLRVIPQQFGKLALIDNYNRSRRRASSTNKQPLDLGENPNLLSPPPEIVSRGTKDILDFLKELHESGTTRYEAKLLVVGEGGTGKSSLLRSLRGEAFIPDLQTTHGIEIDHHVISAREGSQPTIALNTWDFGGQHIYHATHQFFLTRRSLYVVVWNARLGADQGRLHYWLDTIKALAPDAPVILVSTHIDERTPDLNYQLYKEAYPQLAGKYSISNKTGEGFIELRTAIAQQSVNLPLMGQPWPRKWIDAEASLLAYTEHHISSVDYLRACRESAIDEEVALGTLGNYLHDLGKILYFRDDDILCNMIVLKPNWVTKAISRVLTNETVIANKGILLHSDLSNIWIVDDDGKKYERHLYPAFLRLMERFDLSYQLSEPGEQAISSLIPQLLPHELPSDLPVRPDILPNAQSMVEMIYRLDFVPTGIMSWFIVRTHRYTRGAHWREGVFLEYEGHQARVELNPMLREIRITVWGSFPENFFTILMKTLDDILKRFEGLEPERRIPCI